MKVQAVIGANFGDEGKGLVTDYLARHNDIVVRFNGGAQAGHTVVTPEGLRHVFHHFGSGSFAKAQTFLSRYFQVNPILFVLEHKELIAKGYRITPFIDPDAPVTTPYDMMLNQAVEKKRGVNKHGSCGLGINETIHRTLGEYRYLLQAKDFRRPDYFRRVLCRIRDDYMPQRMRELNLTADAIPLRLNERIFERFLEDAEYVSQSSILLDWATFARRWRGDYLFEGAQGLRLDEAYCKGSVHAFPHVTRGRTGMPNVWQLMYEAKLQSIDTYYVSRPYITRHGAGPLEYPAAGLEFDPPNETNKFNEHQGAFRFGLLDPEILRHDIENDLVFSQNIEIKSHLAITCMDHIRDDKLQLAHSMIPKEIFISQLPSWFWHENIKIDVPIVSYGPTRKDVVIP